MNSLVLILVKRNIIKYLYTGLVKNILGILGF
jgi:hypothetical protein